MAAKEFGAFPLAPPTTATRSGSKRRADHRRRLEQVTHGPRAEPVDARSEQRLHAFRQRGSDRRRIEVQAGSSATDNATLDRGSSRSLRRTGHCLPPSPRSVSPAPRATGRRRAAPERSATFPEPTMARSCRCVTARLPAPKADHIPDVVVCRIRSRSSSMATVFASRSSDALSSQCRSSNTRINGVSRLRALHERAAAVRAFASRSERRPARPKRPQAP